MAQQRIDFEPIDFEPLDFEPVNLSDLQPEKGVLRKFKDYVNRPIFGSSGMNSDYTQVPAALLDILRNTISNPSSIPAMVRGAGEGMRGGVQDLLTPLNIADAATGFGKGKVLQGANRVLSGLVAASGADELAQGNIPRGLAELFGGIVGLPARGNASQVLPELVEELPESLRLTGDRLLNPSSSPVPRQLPARGQTSQVAGPFSIEPQVEQPRFFQGPLGTADNNLDYMIDLADPLKINSPFADEMVSTGHLGRISPIDAASRGLGKIPGRALFDEFDATHLTEPPRLEDPLSFTFPENVGYSLGEQLPSANPIRLTPEGNVLPTGMMRESLPEPPVRQLHREGGEIVSAPKAEPTYDPNKFDVTNRRLSDYDELIEPQIQAAVRKPGREQLTDSQNKLMEALELSGPLNRKQQDIYRAEKGQRIRNAVAAAENLYGTEAVKAYKNALKGEYEKVTIPKLEQVDVEALLNDVIKSPKLTGFERGQATDGLQKLLSGGVPQPKQVQLLSRVFGDEIVPIVRRKLPFGDKAGNIISEVVNFPRAIMATADFSAPLRQGLPLIHRKEWRQSLLPMFKSAWSEQTFKDGMEMLRSKPSFERQQEAGLSFSDLLSEREERLMSTWIERVPGIGRVARGSNRAYTMFLNKLRSDTFDSLIADAAKSSSGKVDPITEGAIAEFVNNATGRGSLKFGPVNAEKYANALNTSLFSPRLQASRVKLINNVLNPYEYYKAPPTLRKESLKTLFSIVGIGSTLATLANWSGIGTSTLDSNSSDFGKIKIGNTRIDPYAGFQQYAVLADRLSRGQTTSPVTGNTREFGTGFTDPTRLSVLQNFGESKVHPTLGLVINLLRGTDYAGQPVELKNEMMKRSVPILFQDLKELYEEDPALLPLGLPALLGMGVSSFGTN